MVKTVREYRESDLPDMAEIWNCVVREGVAFPQENQLCQEEAALFFSEQSYTGVAELEGRIAGLYILHPNNVGRCGHIANASYAVGQGLRGRRIGEHLVRDSLDTARRLGFRILQFNAVVATNEGAIRLYKKMGFRQLGVIPGGFRMDDGTFVDILPFYIELSAT